MAPIPRCDIRLPSEPRGQRTPQTQANDQGATDAAESGATSDSAQVRGALHAQRSKTRRDSAEILEDASQFSTGLTRDMAEIRDHKLHEDAADADATSAQAGGHGALHAHRSSTRDSAEILEDAQQFSTRLTRDMVEVRDHKLHEAAEGGAIYDDDDDDGGAGQILDPCTVLEQCRAEIEAEAAVTAGAAAVSDEEDTTSPQKTVGGAVAAAAATPGDVCAQFCKNRADSPSSGYNLHKAVADDGGGKRRRAPQACKGTYAALETYTSLWGSTKAVGARKKMELEMKKKRKYYEKVHERNRRRREREKRRAREKRRMMRCRDQSKIPQTIDDVSINKAFYFRFNYNKRLPFMTSAMDQHLRRFRKPPFKHFHKGERACHKQVDEFEKLRVTDDVAAAAKSQDRQARARAAPQRQPPSSKSRSRSRSRPRPPAKAKAKA